MIQQFYVRFKLTLRNYEKKWKTQKNNAYFFNIIWWARFLFVLLQTNGSD